MIYLVGGVPRVGKTSLVHHVIAEQPMHAISSDAIRYMLRHTLSASELPEMLRAQPADDHAYSPQEIQARQDAESQTLWPYIAKIAESYTLDGFDLLVEGVAVLPELCQSLTMPYRALFIGNTDMTHPNVVLEHVADNPHDWLHKYSEQEQRIFVDSYIARSEVLKNRAAQADMEYSDIHDATFTQDIATAAKQILKH